MCLFFPLSSALRISPFFVPRAKGPKKNSIEKTFYRDEDEDGLCANFPHRQIDLRSARKVAGKQGGGGWRVQVETLAGIALPRGLFRSCSAARDSCGPTDSPSTSRKIEGGRETNSAARPLFTEKRLLLHTSPYTSR